MKNKIAISTYTWIRNNEERDIVFETLKTLGNLNLPIIIADGGSNNKDASRIEKLKNVKFFKRVHPGFKQFRLSHIKGSRIGDFIFHLQSDKLDFAKNHAERMIDYYFTKSKMGLLQASRSKESYNNYPEFQRKNEDFIDLIMSDCTEFKCDYGYGPKIFSSKLVKYLSKVKVDIGFGIEAFYCVIAKRLGIPIEKFEIDSGTPKDFMDEKEVRKFRVRVTKWYLDGYLEGMEAKL